MLFEENVILSTTAPNADFIIHRRQCKVNQQFISRIYVSGRSMIHLSFRKKKRKKFILFLLRSLWVDTGLSGMPSGFIDHLLFKALRVCTFSQCAAQMNVQKCEIN